MKITFISDTHNKHKYLTSNAYDNILGSGDVLVHAGDVSSMGKSYEINDFLNWFSKTPFTYKIFIAGNHDFHFESYHDIAIGYKEQGVHYLFDSDIVIDGIKFYGSPWQPEFHGWAFNLPRGSKLAEKWFKIPEDADILITHGPPFGKLDYVRYGNENVGCEELMKRVEEIKPKIHVFGHIHEGYGYVFDGNTHYINAAVLNDRYEYRNRPVNVIWDTETNEMEFV
jgi:predicted phosphohydrolase